MIKHLLNQGVSKAQIVRETGVCRQTVYNVLNQEVKPKVPRSSLLDPFKDHIRKRLETYDLSAKRLFDEIRQQGYSGSYSTVKPFVRALKGAKVTQLTERYETLPGEHAQFDWGECGSIEENGQRKKLYVFTLLLGYSRMLFALFTTSMNQQTLLTGLQQGFQRTHFRLSGLPMKKRLEDFDFEAQPQVPKAMIQELATLRFLAQGENVILMGPCGVGKTHLAVGLAIRALEEGRRVAFTTLHQLVSKVQLAQQRSRLDGLLSNYLRADLLVLDEIGFLPLQSAEANFLFELVNARYQRQKALIVTSNKTFSQWEDLFPERLLAVALLDRLLHHGHALNIQGESYRLKHRREAGLAPIYSGS